MEIRLAVVQRGDYLRTRRLIESGEAETYLGMRESVEALKRLLEPQPHCVINLGAPANESLCVDGHWHHYVHIPTPPRFVPRRLAFHVAGLRLLHHLIRFRPTHLLLRDDTLIGYYAARYAQLRGVPTLAIFSGPLDTTRSWNRRFARRYMRLLNHPTFHCVANFRQAATDSLIANGLSGSKATAYEFAARATPASQAVRRLDETRPIRLLCTGRLVAHEGVQDLLEAVIQLSDNGLRLRLDVLGDGPDLSRLKNLADVAPPGLIELHGHVEGQFTEALLQAADVLCVAASPAGAERVPPLVADALALRIPVLADDRSALSGVLRHGEGVCFFTAQTPGDLALKLQQIAVNPRLYHALSRTTADAFNRVATRTRFADLLEAWRLTLLKDARARASNGLRATGTPGMVAQR